MANHPAPLDIGLLPRWRALRVPTVLRGVSRTQALTLLLALAVAGAMAAVSSAAQRDADRHRRAQILVERVRVGAKQIDALSASIGSAPVKPLLAASQVAWNDLHAALAALHELEPGARTRSLERDTKLLGAAGGRLARVLVTQGPAAAERQKLSIFSPALAKLDSDAAAASREAARTAEAAIARSTRALFGSLFVGLMLLVLLAWRLARRRREAVVANEVLAVERRTEERLRALIEHSSDVITVVDADLSVRWQAPSIRRLLGRDPAGLVGQELAQIAHPDDVVLLEQFLTRATEGHGNPTLAVRLGHADGRWLHVEAVAENRLDDPAVEGIVLNMRDVTDRKALEEELRRRAFHDGLTNLANRALFEDRLRHACAGALRRDGGFAVLFLDIDDFKTVNDSLGHRAGDGLLRDVAQRIAGVVRPADTAARFGGDEFAVLLEDAIDVQSALEVAERLLDSLRVPFVIEGHELTVTGSIGVAATEGAASADDLMRNADIAMYSAKDQGKNSVRVYKGEMHRHALDRLKLRGELQRAIDGGEFALAYQPILELRSGRIASVEALVRWNHPVRGCIAPDRFISLAEETGAIKALGLWVLTSACSAVRGWQQMDPSLAHLGVSVNVSIKQLEDPSFPQSVAEALATTGLEPGALTLEITETLLVEDRDEMIGRLERLRALGVRLAVDDFGMGYSVLSRLQQFPFDVLKVDKSFIEGIARDAGKANLVRGILDLGHKLGLDLVAEGIEEPGQADRLRAMGWPLGQGYLFSHPLAPEAIEALMLPADVPAAVAV